jgi:AhpD family alkylhydroperoxidase
MMTHEQASELLAVFALDAVDSDEQELIEVHLAECPRCRAELDAHRDVAAALGNSVEQLPEGLWSSIASRLPPRPAEEPPPMPALVREGSALQERTAPTFRTPSPAPRRASRGSRGSRGRLFSLASLAVAAAAVAAVLGVNLVHANDHISSLQNSSPASATAALRVPGHKVVDAESARHVELARFVVVPSGQGYLLTSDLPTLSSAKTYQLWGIIRGQAISLGLLGQDPHDAAFTWGGSAEPSKLGITVEPAGGSVVPTGSMLAAGTV